MRTRPDAESPQQKEGGSAAFRGAGHATYRQDPEAWKLKHALVALVVLLLFAFVYSPILSAGLLAGDYAVLLQARVPWSASADGSSKPLAALSLVASRLAWGLPTPEEAASVARLVHLENLCLHVLAAVGIGLAARRLLLPWTGSEGARAASRAAGLLYLLHPFAPCAVADLGARGDLLGLSLSAWSVAAFLRGRQDRRPGATLASLLLAALAGLSSDVALGLPPLLLLCEYTSSHRYRPRRVRLRTSATTLVVFGASVSLELVLRLARGGTEALPARFASLAGQTFGEGLGQAFLSALAKVGLLVLPGNQEVSGLAGVAVGGTAMLLAVQPALVAARSAPRLWGWLLVAWITSLAFSELLHARVDVRPEEFWHARKLLPSAAVLVVGLGLTSTALSGPRRPFVAWAVAIGYAILAHGNARPFAPASEEVEQLRRDVAAALDVHPGLRTLVVDPPLPGRGVDPVGDALGWLVHPRLRAGGPADGADERLPDVRGVSVPAFLALVREPELAAWLAEGLLVVVPREALGEAGTVGGTQGRPFRKLVAPTPSTGPRSAWRGDLNSPAMDLEPLLEDALRVRVSAGVDLESLRRLSWNARGSETPDRGSVEGAWRPAGDAYEGLFDLGSSLAWRLSGRVQAMRFAQGIGSIASAEVLSNLPVLESVGEDGSPDALEPRAQGDDWSFAPPAGVADPDRPERVGDGFTLGLLDLSDLSWRALPVLETDTGLRVPGAALQTAGRPGPLVWVLDYRIGGHVVARARGRRDASDQ